jgi:8-oxo-dGTP pyrophosphatase MutT (NUDIX family)
MERLRASLARRGARPTTAPPEQKRAAVAAILRDVDGDAEVLLIRRASHPNDPWSGHMAFPGGRLEPGDPDALAAAVRETREEIGLDLAAHGELLGALDDLPAGGRVRSPLVVSPFVFRLRRAPGFLLKADEVDEVLWARLGPLRRGEAPATVPYEIGGKSIDLPGFRVGRDVVWGLTHRMLTCLFERFDDVEALIE